MRGYRRWKGRVGGSRFEQNKLYSCIKFQTVKKVSELEMELSQSVAGGGVSVSDDLRLFFKTFSHLRHRTKDPN